MIVNVIKANKIIEHFIYKTNFEYNNACFLTKSKNSECI